MLEDLLISFKDVQDNLPSLKREYKRLGKIEILLQQYLFECEKGYGGKTGEKIKETIERRLSGMKATNEDILLALYRLECPHKNFITTRKMVEQYERISDLENVRKRLERLRRYEEYCREKREIYLPALDKATL